jgi:predicted ATPase/class 3 adenylate cyclase
MVCAAAARCKIRYAGRAMGGRRVFLFTDLEGSTRLWERAPDRMGAAVARHDALLAETVARHGGRVFKNVGDGICAVFPAADVALAAALEMQRRVRVEAWPVGPLAIRVSLHAGAAEERDGDFFGTTLNRTARILELVQGGQVLLSAAVRDELAAVPEGADLRDLGEHRLRDLTRPARLHQLVHADLPADFAPLRALDALPHNLPLQLTAFLGRERELAEVGGLLRGARLTTLVGAGGAGKTRLALQVAADAQPRFAAGTWLVELADLADEELVVRAVAAALDVAPERDVPLARQVGGRIGDGEMLLVLDNCEHLLEGAAGLAHELLRRCPRLRILATSREPLRVAGEAVYAVGPLALPPADADAGTIASASACSLFLELARAAEYGFEVDADDARRVAAICRALDGIPLAIELAAACVRRMDLAAIEEGLAHRFDLLRRGPRSALPHHRTLQAALDWSYDLLEEDEQALLRRLSVFVGGWTLASLEAVFGKAARGAHDRLLDHSLVERRGERYRFLESVRAYAAERLAADPDEERACREGHARFVADLLKRSRRELYGEQARAVADELEAEIDNIRAAFEWMYATPAHFERGLNAADSFWVFCWMRGYMPEGRQWLERYLANPAVGDADSTIVGQARYAAGVLAKECGDLDAACRHYEARLAIEGDGIQPSALAMTTSALANVVRMQGDLDRAERLYERSIAIGREIGAREDEAGALNGLATVERLRGRHDRARERLVESLAIFRECGDRRGEVVVLAGLAQAELALGRHDEAYRVLREDFRICREQRDRHHAAEVLFQLGRVAALRERPVRARRFVRASLALSWQQRALFAVLDCLGALADVEADPRRRDRLAGAAFALAAELGKEAELRESAEFEAGREMGAEAAVRYGLGEAASG